ncbi:MAG: hypothetical protein ACI9GW_000107 [Halieaceae bacterium]|jgi:hypothetical protein
MQDGRSERAGHLPLRGPEQRFCRRQVVSPVRPFGSATVVAAPDKSQYFFVGS